jgi:D-serine deaminase-like pyridoxal phosphate-dependent protein
MGTVIGHQRDRAGYWIDAGWMAMSQDRGTAKQASIRLWRGRDLARQLSRSSFDANRACRSPRFGRSEFGSGLGERVRVLPNHACATGKHRFCGAWRVGCDGQWRRFEVGDGKSAIS